MNAPYPGQIILSGGASQQQPPQFQQGYPTEQIPPNFAPQPYGQFQQPMLVKPQQEVKFYKSGLFLIGSAAGRFERDCPRMQSQGWQVKEIAFLGLNVFFQRIIAVVYER